MDYWDRIERTHTGYLSRTWDALSGRYRTGDAWLLMIHSIRVGHGKGTEEERVRARRLVDALVSPTYWDEGAAGWMVAPGLLGFGCHPSVDSRCVEGLYYAWKYRETIELEAGQVARIEEVLRAKAESVYHREEWGNQETAYWYNNALYAAFEVTGDGRYADYWGRYMDHFVAHLDRPPEGGKMPYLYPDFAWNYNDRFLDTVEYGLMCYGGMINAQRMVERGLYRFDEEPLSKVQGYQQYVLGMWRLDGYIHWDTGYGLERLLNGEYWAFSQRALLALAYAESINTGPEVSPYAKFLLDRSIELFGRMDVWNGDPADEAMPLLPYGAGYAFGNKYEANAMFIAQLCQAVDLGIDRMEAWDPRTLWRYNWYHRKLVVSTPRYSAALVGVGKRQFGYGGLELVELCDQKGRSLTVARPDHFPDAISFEIPEKVPVHTHDIGVFSSPEMLPRTSSGVEYLRVVESPDGDLGTLKPYDRRRFHPTFERIVVRGNFETDHYRYDTCLVFGPEEIRVERTLTCVGEVQTGRVVLTIPVSDAIERVSVVDQDGARYPVDVGGSLYHVPDLRRLAALDFEGAETGFVLLPQRVEAGRRTGIWATWSEGSLYTGGPIRVIWLYLAGLMEEERVERIVFDAVWRVRSRL